MNASIHVESAHEEIHKGVRTLVNTNSCNIDGPDYTCAANNARSFIYFYNTLNRNKQRRPAENTSLLCQQCSCEPGDQFPLTSLLHHTYATYNPPRSSACFLLSQQPDLHLSFICQFLGVKFSPWKVPVLQLTQIRSSLSDCTSSSIRAQTDRTVTSLQMHPPTYSQLNNFATK